LIGSLGTKHPALVPGIFGKKMTRFLVTGGAGFIGSHLAEALADEGNEVRVLDTAGRGPWAAQERIRLIHGDLSDLNLTREASRDVDTVFHLAMPMTWNDPLKQILTQHAATAGTMHVLIAAREAGVRRVVYASCGSVYGPGPAEKLSEEHPLAPSSAFALAKEAGEKDCSAFEHLYGLETVRLRLFNVYGPRQPQGGCHGRFLRRVLESALAGTAVEIQGDGQDSLDLLFVGDAVHALLLAARTPRAAGKVYNIGFGQPLTSLQVFQISRRVIGGKLQRSEVVPRPRTEFDNLPDISKAETELGFCPAISLETGIRQTLEAYEQSRANPVLPDSGHQAAEIVTM
jgi:UDP-glucose 4-epimerase